MAEVEFPVQSVLSQQLVRRYLARHVLDCELVRHFGKSACLHDVRFAAEVPLDDNRAIGVDLDAAQNAFIATCECAARENNFQLKPNFRVKATGHRRPTF